MSFIGMQQRREKIQKGTIGGCYAFPGVIKSNKSLFCMLFYFCGLSWRVRNAIVPKKITKNMPIIAKFSMIILLSF